jgi:hypothetical protein
MRVPWVGLAALAAMFLIPLLPSRIFEGPMTVRHWPRRHICGSCNALWTEGHVCAMEPTDYSHVLYGELRRVDAGVDVELPSGRTGSVSRRVSQWSLGSLLGQSAPVEGSSVVDDGGR